MMSTQSLSFQVCPLPSAIAELFSLASNSGVITLHDLRQLMDAQQDECVSEEDKRLINRLLYSIRRGRLQVCQ